MAGEVDIEQLPSRIQKATKMAEESRCLKSSHRNNGKRRKKKLCLVLLGRRKELILNKIIYKREFKKRYGLEKDSCKSIKSDIQLETE